MFKKKALGLYTGVCRIVRSGHTLYMDLGGSSPPTCPSNYRHVLMMCVFLGENPLPPDDPNKELMGKVEVSLTLTNKFDVPGEANTEMDARTLLLK